MALPVVDPRAAPAGTRSSKAPLLVEFLGLPGAGKTTVVGAVAAELGRQGIGATEVFANWNRGKRARVADGARALSALARVNPAALAAAVRVARAPGLRRGTALNLALNWSNRCGHLETARRSSGVQLVDQGVFQAYWSLLFAASRGLDDLLARLEAVRAPLDALVVVRTDPAVIAARLASRPGATSRLERALAKADGAQEEDAEAIRAPADDARAEASLTRADTVLARAEAALAQVVALAKTRSVGSGLTIVEVDNRAADLARGAAIRVIAALDL